MAAIDIWVQLYSPPRIRKISATSLTWLFGTRTRVVALYSTGGTNSTIETFSQVIESAPTTGTAVALAKAITVIQEQVAFELPKPFYPVTGLTSGNTAIQLSPFLRNTQAAESANLTTTGRNYPQSGQLQKVLDIDVFDYVRFTGTELPAAGIIIPVDNISAIFTTEPSASQL